MSARSARPAPADGLLGPLSVAVAELQPQWRGVRLIPLPDTGLAHHHVSLDGTGVLARIPKQSQVQLDAVANLDYQAACFERAAPSGHTPRLHAVLPPLPGLPRGALLVEQIVGRAAELPRDAGAIATALGRIHALPLPAAASRAPLLDDVDPLASLEREIRVQAGSLGSPTVAAETRAIVWHELDRLSARVATGSRPPRRLITFDAHPGNFVVRPDGVAVLVDLEKCRYSYPPLDLAHATLYTSTTWEPGADAVLSPAEVRSFLDRWAVSFRSPVGDGTVGDGSTIDDDYAPWMVPLRRAMWLWSVTWCAKWATLSERPPSTSGNGEDWAAGNSAESVAAHVRERVAHYLDPAVVRRIVEGFDEL